MARKETAGERRVREARTGDWLRNPYFDFSKFRAMRGKLPYPWHEVQVGKDKCMVYDVPKEKLQEVLDYVNQDRGLCIYPVNKRRRVPDALDDKHYSFSRAKVIYYKRYNYIVPPMFFETGATAWGWGIPR